jgi:hypothetical protein
MVPFYTDVAAIQVKGVGQNPVERGREGALDVQHHCGVVASFVHAEEHVSQKAQRGSKQRQVGGLNHLHEHQQQRPRAAQRLPARPQSFRRGRALLCGPAQAARALIRVLIRAPLRAAGSIPRPRVRGLGIAGEGKRGAARKGP